ncbi:hypothetical protein WMY93_031844 [Mugilogobius chulae]|uniref:Uncharacterized protein n=1 Tax=Mugilogobius chulae TaxID=88201 RepID=A0AAW0MHI0_9GOBI
MRGAVVTRLKISLERISLVWTEDLAQETGPDQVQVQTRSWSGPDQVQTGPGPDPVQTRSYCVTRTLKETRPWFRSREFWVWIPLPWTRHEME